VWCYTSVSPACGRLKQEDEKFEVSLGYKEETVSINNKKLPVFSNITETIFVFPPEMYETSSPILLSSLDIGMFHSFIHSPIHSSIHSVVLGIEPRALPMLGKPSAT
jgi:hypothetical protein